MGKHFAVNDNLFYNDDPHAARNRFAAGAIALQKGEAAPDPTPLPRWAEVKERLPRPICEGREDLIALYDKAWEIAFGNLCKARPEAGFVSDFIDTAFNGYLFLWDSAFIVQFGKYGRRAFDFQKTLDNFYAHQHRDGFICREICEEEAGEQFTRDDPASTGPNVLAWAEWEYYRSTGDKSRLADVFDPLFAYHRWLSEHRAWPDGSYWSCGLASGMDNQPRQTPGFNPALSHGFMSWIDACAQQYLSASLLIAMAKELGREAETAPLVAEAKLLYATVNDTMWDETRGFYFDKRRDGSLSDVMTVGAYWSLTAGLVPPDRLQRFIAPLRDEKKFARPCRVPSLAADSPAYRADGGYWLGGVWAPTDYMVTKGLAAVGEEELAGEIADNFIDCVAKVFADTGTLYENYAPEAAAPGVPAKSDFVGWTGLAPIAMLFEDAFGIRPLAAEGKIVWTLRKKVRHGVLRYPIGPYTADLVCERPAADGACPQITFVCDGPIRLEVVWPGGRMTLAGGEQEEKNNACKRRTERKK